MAAKFKVGTIAVKTSTGTQAYTGIGFQPVLVMFWSTGDTTVPSSTPHARTSFGAAVSTTSRFSLACGSTDNLATSDTERSFTETSCASSYNEAGNVLFFRADLSSFDSDGFTLNFTTAGTSGQQIRYLAIGGVSASIISFATPTGTGNQATTGAGFRPECLILASNYVLNTVSPPQDGGAHSLFALGAATSTSQRACMACSSRDNAANAIADSRFSTTKVFTSNWNGALTFGEADLASFDADGFTLNWSTADAAAKHIYAICLAGADFFVGNDTQKTSTGTKAKTGVGFAPEALLLFSHASATVGNIVDSTGSYGASDGTSNMAVGWFDDDGLTTMNTSSRSEDARCLAFVGATESETLGECSVSSLDADGYTLDWQVADGTARAFGFLAMADTPAAGGGDNLMLLGVS